MSTGADLIHNVKREDEAPQRGVEASIRGRRGLRSPCSAVDTHSKGRNLNRDALVRVEWQLRNGKGLQEVGIRHLGTEREKACILYCPFQSGITLSTAPQPPVFSITSKYLHDNEACFKDYEYLYHQDI